MNVKGEDVMGDMAFYVVAVFFCGFGMISFFMCIIDFFYETKYLKNKEIYTFFVSKNEASFIENITRGLIFKMRKSDCGICNHKIFVVDDDSNDGTYEILKKIADEEKSITVIKNNESVKNFFCALKK